MTLDLTGDRTALQVGRKFTGVHLVDVLIKLLVIRGISKFVRGKTGPEFFSSNVSYRLLESIDGGASCGKPAPP